MTTIDFTPLYRSTIGFDRLPSLLDSALRKDQTVAYPSYNVEVVEEHRYRITLAVAGFQDRDLNIEVEKGVLTISGHVEETDRQYLYQGIPAQSFERRFNLADHVQVTDACLEHGLLTIDLVMEVPEELKPRKISISRSGKVLDQKSDKK